MRCCSSFGNCTSLRRYLHPPGEVTHGCSSFGNCTSLRLRVLFASPEAGGCSSFGNCTSLRQVIRRSARNLALVGQVRERRLKKARGRMASYSVLDVGS